MYRNMGIRRLWIIGICRLHDGAVGGETVNGGFGSYAIKRKNGAIY